MIKLKGRLGGVTFYETEAGYRARTSTGVDAQRVKRDPAFRRSRENASEFGRAAKAAGYLRGVLRPLLLHNPDGSMVNRLTSRMVRALKADGVHDRGERQVSAQNAGMLRFFDFNRSAPLHETLLARYRVQLDDPGNQVLLTLPAFNAEQAIVFAADATHFQLTAAAVRVDFYPGMEDGYPLLAMQATERLPLTAEVPAMSFALPLEGSPGSVIVLIGLSFYESVRGEVYPLKDKALCPLGIVEVW